MRARLLLKERTDLGDAFVELVIRHLPRSLPGPADGYQYRMALVKQGVGVIRYDNEARKGDHRHVDGCEGPYRFIDLATLIRDCRQAVKESMT
ncbi:MAG: toxin-antitoxin system TumE family protein [Acetobacteraceae bacterium]